MLDDFQTKLNDCPPALQAIVEEFAAAEPRERLDLLLDFANALPALPERFHGARDAMEQVHECQSPVFLHTEIAPSPSAGGDPTVLLHFDIPMEAPTIRGYAAALVEGLSGATPAQTLQTPEDVYLLMGLHEAISPQRVRGLHALMVYIKRQVRASAQP